MAALITPTFLSTFAPGLANPEMGPVVPLFSPLLGVQPHGVLSPNYDLFLPLASAMQQEAEDLRAERPFRQVPRSSLLRWIGTKHAPDGLPRDVGAAPENRRLHWILSSADSDEGVAGSLSLHQARRHHRLGTRLTIRYREKAVHVGVSYGIPDCHVSHRATASRERVGDFQGIDIGLSHNKDFPFVSTVGALLSGVGLGWLRGGVFLEGDPSSGPKDAVYCPLKTESDIAEFAESLEGRGHFFIRAGHSVFCDDLSRKEDSSALWISMSAKGHRTARQSLNVSYLRSWNDPLFPEALVRLANRVADEAKRRLGS
jgi:hypothetical protein